VGAWEIDRMLSIKASIFTFAVSALLTVVFGNFLTGCQTDEVVVAFDNYEYLELSNDADLSNLSSLSIENEKKFSMAFNRITIINEKGLYRLKQSSGKQINISEELFDYFKAVIETTNKFNAQRFYKRPRLKDPSEIANNFMTNNCVASAISSTGFSIYSLQALSLIIYTEFGGDNGVPDYNFYNACSKFLTGSATSLPSESEFAARGTAKYIVAARDSVGGGHAGVLNAVSNSGYIYFDSIVTESSNVTHVFKATGSQ